MTKNRELELLTRIASLEQRLNEECKQSPELPTYNFGKITLKELRNIFDLERIYDHHTFDEWFNTKIMVTDNDIQFLKALLDQEIDLIKVYNEEDLKVHFIAPILNKINFKSFEYRIRDFYEESLVYETEDFILSGTTDFIVASGLEYPEQPYFFIQEFKKGLQYSNPEPQLLAGMITAIELNKVEQIKGAYVIGGNWNFLLLNRLEKHRYQYSVSKNYDSTDLDKLIAIYKYLNVVKADIFPA